MEFSGQEYRNRLSFSPQGDLPDSVIKSTPPVSPELAGGFFTTDPSGKPVDKISQKLFLKVGNTHILYSYSYQCIS